MKIDKIINSLLNLIFPIECLNCREENVWLCEKCLSILLDNHNKQITCPICNKKNYMNGQVCSDCQKNYCLDKVFISASYENKLIQKIIKTYKYNFIKDLKKPLSEIMINYFEKFYQKEKFDVIPSPLSKKRLRWRGFNQSELMAEKIAECFNFEYMPNLVIKKKNTQEQAELTRKQRLLNVQNSFQLSDNKNIKGKSFLIIDDVITTGATLSEIAKILKENGAIKIWALVIAKN